MNYVPALILAAVFWNYFYLTSVELNVKGGATGIRFQRPFLFYPHIIRTCICITPFWALLQGKDINNNVFLCWLALVTAINPLLIPVKEPDWNRSYPRFFFNWMMSELDIWVKTGSIVLVFWLLFKLVGFTPHRQAAWLESLFSFYSRKTGSLELPVVFYLLCFFVLLVKCSLMFGIEQLSVASVISAFLCGIIVLLYFYNLSGKIVLEESRFETFAGGFFTGWALKFVIALSWAKFDYSMAGEESV